MSQNCKLNSNYHPTLLVPSAEGVQVGRDVDDVTLPTDISFVITIVRCCRCRYRPFDQESKFTVSWGCKLDSNYHPTLLPSAEGVAKGSWSTLTSWTDQLVHLVHHATIHAIIQSHSIHD